MKTLIKDLFLKEEVEQLSILLDMEKAKRELVVWDEFSGEPFPQAEVDDSSKYIQNISLGKIMFNFEVPENIKSKLEKIARDAGFDVDFFCATYTEYCGKYGDPVLQPHKDKMNFCLIDYQLDANTSWPLYADDDQYDLQNNEALMFLPAQSIHGRIFKRFTDEEVIKMIFFDMKFRNEDEKHNN